MDVEERWTMTVSLPKKDFERMEENSELDKTNIMFCNYYCIPEDSMLRYHLDDLKKRMNKTAARKVRMQGLMSDLLKIKNDIENACTSIWDAEWAASEAAYFGWEGEIYEQQIDLCSTIKENLLNVYADVLIGLYGVKEN